VVEWEAQISTPVPPKKPQNQKLKTKRHHGKRLDYKLYLGYLSLIYRKISLDPYCCGSLLAEIRDS
jgi:hypothetical protein